MHGISLYETAAEQEAAGSVALRSRMVRTVDTWAPGQLHLSDFAQELL